jgi:hypothetical protein
MDRFTRNPRDNLQVSRGSLIVASLVIAALIIALVAAYSFFDLGAVLPKRRP